MGGIRASLVVTDPPTCPVAHVSGEIGEPIRDVARSASVGPGGVTEEFEVPGEAAPAELSVEGVRRVFSVDDVGVYRFRRDDVDGCVCEVIERSGTPVSALRAENGALFVWLHAPDVETLRSIVAELRETFDEVRLRHLAEENADRGDDYVLVDRNQLTDRQREVLRTAFEMGYFDYDSGTNAGDVAEALGISQSTFAEHLSAAQTKLLEPLVDDSA
ncbi:MAG: helix-turn-helix domain-containing protein [Haloferacaceae archaeon]